MKPHKIEIDLDRLEDDILGYDKLIEDANKIIENASKERDKRVQLREYIISTYLHPEKITPKPILIPNFGSDRKITNETGSGPVGQQTGISDFIREFIKVNPAHTKTIGKAYAVYKKVPYDGAIRKVMSRALTRLKMAGEITNEAKDGGRRAGSDWKLIRRQLTLG